MYRIVNRTGLRLHNSQSFRRTGQPCRPQYVAGLYRYPLPPVRYKVEASPLLAATAKDLLKAPSRVFKVAGLGPTPPWEPRDMQAV
jgi:hypothetical protein